MKTYQDSERNTLSIASVSIVDRAVIGFAGIVTVVAGMVTSPTLIFVLSGLGIYLVHSAIIGLDPVHAALRFTRNTLTHRSNQQPLTTATSH